jgi:porin
MTPLSPRHYAALALSALTLVSATVYAGSESYGAPRRTGASAQESGSQFGITGDWGGLRNSFQDAGVTLDGFYAGETFVIAKGGLSRGTVVGGLLKLGLTAQLEPLLGWPGATFRVSGLAPHGTSGSSRHAGDISLFSNFDAYDSVRLVDFWLEQRLLEDTLSVKVGQLLLDDEFALTDSATLFINSSFGAAYTAVTPMPLATYPSGALGIRARIEPVKGLYGQLAVYDGNPSQADYPDPTTRRTTNVKRNGTDWALRQSEGYLWAGEIGYQRTDEYPGAYRIGFLHHTDGFVSLSTPGKIDGSNNSGYFVLDQTLWQKSGSPKEGLAGFVRGISAQEKRNTMSRSIQTGLTYTGLVNSSDRLGLAYARNQISRYRTPGGDSERITEVSYQYPLQSYLKVQPDLQFIQHPGGSAAIPNAWVVGVRAIVEF